MLRLNTLFPNPLAVAARIQIQPMLRLNPAFSLSGTDLKIIQIQPMLRLNIHGLNRKNTMQMRNSNTTNVKVKPKYPIKTAPVLKLFKYNQC